uniref:Uncharacterized protein n=1 Tax=Melicertus latisulcatus pemonivirus TaxID=2984278 RepID=A0A9C7CDG3_9VIRU|nr:MAG: hypothetical protein [Melicertus latisulcatus pemonivirus]
MNRWGPDTLRSTALVRVADLTMNAVVTLFNGLTSRRKGVKRMRKDDGVDTEVDSGVCQVRNYIVDTPSALIDDLVELVLQSLCEDRHFKSSLLKRKRFYSIVMDIVPWCRLSRFFDEWIAQYVKRECSSLMYSRLNRCAGLRKLSLTEEPCGRNILKHASLMFRNFSHLTTLRCIPEVRGVSFHWILEPIIENCRKLREFHLVYNGVALEESGCRIGDLSHCRDLVSLWLLDYSATVSVGVVDNLQKLLMELTSLKFLFHKKVTSAILEPNDKISGTLGLERLDLWSKCDEPFSDCVGQHNVVLDTDELLRLTKTCPAIRILKLTKPPPCIDAMSKALPKLEVLEMSKCHDTPPSLSRALRQDSLKNLTVIKLEEILKINYTSFSELAHHCRGIEVLSISNSTIKADGQLTLPPLQSSAFPHLKELTLTPRCSWHIECHCQEWEVGKRLTRYLLKGTHNLNGLHVHYNDSYDNVNDRPTNSFILEILEPLKFLTSLQLVSSMYMNCQLIREIVKCCPLLVRLGAFGSWKFDHAIDYGLPPLELDYRCDCA